MARNGYMALEGSGVGLDGPESDFDADVASEGRILTNCPPGHEYVVDWAIGRDEMDDADDRLTHRILEDG